MQVPITTNNDAHSRYVSPFLEKNYAGFGTSESRERQRPVGANESCWPLGLSSGFQGRRAAGERLTILQGEGRVYLSFESWGGSLKANSYTSQSVQW